MLMRFLGGGIGHSIQYTTETSSSRPEESGADLDEQPGPIHNNPRNHAPGDVDNIELAPGLDEEAEEFEDGESDALSDEDEDGDDSDEVEDDEDDDEAGDMKEGDADDGYDSA
jgi:hypothetical protein